MVAKVFKDMTSEGGKFYNMQEVQAETLKGKISNLKDAYEMMLNEIGKGQSENLKGAVDWARKLMTNYEDTGRILVELVATYGIYKAALVAVEVVTNSFALANHKLISSLVSAGKYLLANPFVAVTAAITALGYAAYKSYNQLEGFQKIQKSVSDSQKNFTKELDKETTKLDALYAKLKLAKKGTEEYDAAKKEIYSQYAGYISELRNEGIEVNDLAGIYDNLRTKIEDATKARTSSKAKQRLTETYDQEIDAYYDRYIEIITKARAELNRQAKRAGGEYAEFSEFEKAGFWKFVSGSMNMGDLERTTGMERVVSVLKNATIDASANLKLLRAEMVSTTKEYNNALLKIRDAYGETADIIIQNPFGGGGGEEGGKSDAQKAIEEQIKSIQKLKDAYEKLLPYLDELQMKSTLKELFPNIGVGIIDSLDFNAELERLADRLAEFDADAAQRLRDSVSKDIAGSIAESFKAMEQYKKMLDAWMGEDFDIMGEGTAFDICKILTNLNSEYAKIDQRRQNALDLLNKAQLGDEVALAKVREVYGEEVWEKYLAKGEQVINELAAKEAQAARHTANEKIRDLADKDLKERMEKANINLTDFDDKTIAQVERAYDRLFDVYIQLRNEIEWLKMNGVTEEEEANVQRLEAEVKQLETIIQDTGVELEKKLYDRAKSSMQAISKLGSSIQGLGDAIGASGIAEFGKSLSQTADLASDLMEAFKAKDTIAIISNFVSAFISTVSDTFSAAYERQLKLNEATLEYAEIMRGIRREAYSGVFGTDEMALAAENQQILADAQKDYNDAMSKFQNERSSLYNKRDVSVQWNKTVEELLSDFARADGWELYRENGELNIDALKAYYESFAGDLTSYQKSMIDNLITSYDAMNDAAAQSAEYMTSLFSSAADTIADKMVGAFLESGSAAVDLKDVVSDVASQMASDLIKTLYIMPILNQYAEQLQAIAANNQLSADEKTAAALGVLQTGVEQIKDNEDAINETLEQLDEFFARGEEGTTDLGEGIKGITEDQANLLASYLNAIRADVSFSKTLWIRMDDNLQKIANMLTSSPTLMEYQAQIAANTYDTAMASQAILSELRSVISTDSGDTAIRVQS